MTPPFSTDKIETPPGTSRRTCGIAGESGPRSPGVRALAVPGHGEVSRCACGRRLSARPTVTAGVLDISTAATWPRGTVTEASSPGMMTRRSRRCSAARSTSSLVRRLPQRRIMVPAARSPSCWPLVAPGGFYVVEDWMVSLRGPSERPGEDVGEVLGRRDAQGRAVLPRAAGLPRFRLRVRRVQVRAGHRQEESGVTTL